MEHSIQVPRKGTLDNLVSEPQQVAFKGVNRRTKTEETGRAAVSKVGHRNLQKSGTVCIPQRAVLVQRRVLCDRLIQLLIEE